MYTLSTLPINPPYPPSSSIHTTMTPPYDALQGLKDQLQIAYKTEKFNDSTGIGESKHVSLWHILPTLM